MFNHRFVRRSRLALLVGAAACGSYLTGGELSTDPNRPTQATATQLFVGIQSNLWAELQSDPVRITSMWVQQFTGTNQQYVNIYEYGVSEQTTNGFHAALYTGGGLVDIRKLQQQAASVGDSLFLGIAQVQEALLIGTGADLFGDLVYTQALKGANPPLDPQLTVYDSVQVLLSRAIVNLSASGPTNVGPEPAGADLSYGGNALQWTKLAHTLKARFYLHTGEVRPGAYGQALSEAILGITSTSDDLVAVFSGNADEQNFWYQFVAVQRAGYLTPNAGFVGLLESRGDPRLSDYFNADQSDISDARLAPDYTQPLVTANENLLIWSEAAYRTGNETVALNRLNAERALAGLPGLSGLSGRPLLAEILTEKYIQNFQSLEGWNDYKRTCTPNLAPVVPGRKITARLFYDSGERQTDSSIPLPTQQPARNANDPPNATSDASGLACLGQ